MGGGVAGEKHSSVGVELDRRGGNYYREAGLRSGGAFHSQGELVRAVSFAKHARKLGAAAGKRRLKQGTDGDGRPGNAQ